MLTVHETECLIEPVRMNPVLYDARYSAHKDGQLLLNTWNSIAAEIGVSGMDGK